MNISDEYERKIAARAAAEIAQEQWEWDNKTPEQKAEFWRLRHEKAIAEDERQKRIARQFFETFGPDDPEESEDE